MGRRGPGAMLRPSSGSIRGRLSIYRSITAWLPAPPDHRRADIDGLRAVAVLGVLGFHAFPLALGGGYVGVDVFFVISGYLISGILFDSIESGRFRLTQFYARRIRRIFPALLLVLLAVLVAGYLTLFAREWLPLLRQVVAGAAFASNFLLWSEAGYFERASELKPLLHLWSLAIEEQFYLLWPALLWLLRGRRGWTVLIVVAVGGSLASSVIVTVSDPTAGFYSPATRFWELGLGALLARLALRRGAAPDDALTRGVRWLPSADALSLVGLLAILASMVLIDRTQGFPGSLALVPTLGAAMLIAAGPRAVANRRLLAHPVAVAIGTISYPLYLWHWPLLTFARILGAGDPSPALRSALLALSLLLAWLTYVAFEAPIRNRVPLAWAACTSLAAMVGTAVIAAGLSTPADPQARAVHLRGELTALRAENLSLLEWPTPDLACIRALDLDAEAKIAKESLFCSIAPGTAPVSVAILGDSTANHLYPGLAHLYAERGERVLNAGNGTCAPFHGLSGHYRWNLPCERVNRKLYEYVLASPSIRTVILGLAPWDIQSMDIEGLGATRDPAGRFAAIRPWVLADIASLRAADKQVIVTFDTPLIGLDAEACALDATRCSVAAATVEKRMEPFRSYWRELFAGAPGVCIYSQDALFRLPDGSYTALHHGRLLYRDDHHLSTYGSAQVAEGLRRSSCF